MSVARKYVELQEAQLHRAESATRSAAMDAYRKLPNPNETDYEEYVAVVERMFSDDYQPILRATEIIYLHMVFETFVSRHVGEIDILMGEKPGILKKLRKDHRSGVATAAKIYFQENVHWSVLEKEEWTLLCDLAAVRNCIVHNSGVVRNTKHAPDVYRLEGKFPEGIKILRGDDGRDAGHPIMINYQLVEYNLILLEKLFDALGRKTHAEFWSKRT